MWQSEIFAGWEALKEERRGGDDSEGREREEGGRVAYFGADEEYSAQHPLNILYGQFSCILYHVSVCMHVGRGGEEGGEV